MRNGDFRGTASSRAIPTPGVAFPGQVIPANRIDPAARNIMNFFWPLPNQPGTISGGYGVFQQFVPITRDRERADLRLDHEVSGNDSLFLRGSYQHRDPQGVTFEAGPALTNLPILKNSLNTASVIAGWTKIFSPTVVNEFRVGYNYDNSERESNYGAAGHRRAARPRERAQPDPRSPRLPADPVHARAPTGPPTSPTRPATWTAR